MDVLQMSGQLYQYAVPGDLDLPLSAFLAKCNLNTPRYTQIFELYRHIISCADVQLTDVLQL